MSFAKRLIIVLVFTLCTPTMANAKMVNGEDALDQLINKAAPRVEEMVETAKKEIKSWWQTIQSKVAEFRGEPKKKAPAPKPVLTEADKKREKLKEMTAQLPKHQRKEDKEKLANIISNAKGQMKDALVVSSPGRKGTSKLKKTKVGRVPYINIPKSKIPELDIGEERTLRASDLVPSDLKVGFAKLEKIKQLKSPRTTSQKKVLAVVNKKFTPAQKKLNLKQGKYGLGNIVTQKKIEKVDLVMNLTKPLQEDKPLHKISKSDLEMLHATILFNHKSKCHLALGLFYNLTKYPKHQEEATYYFGACSHKMGFYSESIDRLLNIIKKPNSEYAKEALGVLVKDLPKEYQVKVANALKTLKDQSLVSGSARDDFNYVLSKGSYLQRQYTSAQGYADKVSEKSSKYPQAQYVSAIAKYSLGQEKAAEKQLEALRKWLVVKKKKNKNIESLIAINLGRMKFRQKRYKAAYRDYMKVHKDHPEHIRALIEQGWTQLQVGDPAGAIGNMYSLHSPYFRVVYKPESYAVRTIGYLNICQYGDAYRTLTQLEQKHKKWLKAVNSYVRKNKKSRSKYYKTVKNYLRGKSDQNVDGLPYQVIREIARQRGYINAQAALNNREDELEQYNFIHGIIKKDQGKMRWKRNKAQARLKKLKANLKKAKKNAALVKFVNQWKAQLAVEQGWIEYYKFQLKISEASRKHYLVFRKMARKRIGTEKYKLRQKAGRELIGNLNDLRVRMGKIIENNEFLRYEVFSGAGENIRYQVAGGKTSSANRIPASVKPKKIMNWEFAGEYWQDEIGSYRSTLKNNCPKYGRSHANL